MSTAAQRTRFRQTVRRQNGVVSLDQARAAGISRASVARRVASKAWFPAGPRVYQLAEHESTPRSRVFAATLSLGPAAVLVGRSAAWWWGLLDTAPAQVEVAVRPPVQPRPRPGVDVVRRPIMDEDRTVVAGVAVTKRPATVLDAAIRLGLSEGARLMDRALQTERVTLDGLRDAHVRTTGRHGAGLAGELLVLASGGARSWAERAVIARLQAAGILGWSANVEIRLPGFGTAVGDLVFVRARVVVEIDGWAYHRDLRAFLRDGPRQSALAAAGWIVLRTHWYELQEDPGAFVARLRSVLASRS